MHVSDDTDATTTFNVGERILCCEDVGDDQVTHIAEARQFGDTVPVQLARFVHHGDGSGKKTSPMGLRPRSPRP